MATWQTQFNDPQLVALKLRGRDWPRGLLSATRVPDGWRLLIEPPGGTRLMLGPGQEPQPRDDDVLLLARTEAFDVPLTVRDVPAADKHPVDATMNLTVQIEPRPEELAALRRHLLRGERLTFDALAQRLQDAARPAIISWIRSHPAAVLVQTPPQEALGHSVGNALQQLIFECGLQHLGMTRVRCRSATQAQAARLERETADRVRQIEARKQIEQAAAAAAHRRLDDMTRLLAKLRDAADTERGLRWHELLPGLSPSERTQLLENLWRIAPNRRTCRHIVAVSGGECVWVDPAEPTSLAHRVAIPSVLGPLRSVRYDAERDLLLVGAATGVWALSPDNGAVQEQYGLRVTHRPRTGFNSVAIVGEHIIATHSRLGCWRWACDDPSDVRPLLSVTHGTPRTVRGVIAAPDGRAYFSADDCVYVVAPGDDTPEALTAAGEILHCLACDDSRLYAGTAEGNVLRIDLDPLGEWTQIYHAADAIESLAPRRWNDLVELVVPADELGVVSLFGDEAAAMRLLAGDTDVRRVWASDDVVAALNGQRDRLVVLNANLPGRTAVEAFISRRTGHSIQDAALVTKIAAAVETKETSA